MELLQMEQNEMMSKLVRACNDFCGHLQRQEETQSPNSIQKQPRADFRFRIGMAHFLEASRIPGQNFAPSFSVIQSPGGSFLP